MTSVLPKKNDYLIFGGEKSNTRPNFAPPQIITQYIYKYMNCIYYFLYSRSNISV